MHTMNPTTTGVDRADRLDTRAGEGDAAGEAEQGSRATAPADENTPPTDQLPAASATTAPGEEESTEQTVPSNVRPLHGSAAENLARAYRRALDEGLVAYPQPDGRWYCKHYAIDLTGPSPLDVDCDCADAVFRERLCKHAVCVVFCRVYGYLPCPPVAASGVSILPDCVDDFVARLERANSRLSA